MKWISCRKEAPRKDIQILYSEPWGDFGPRVFLGAFYENARAFIMYDETGKVCVRTTKAMRAENGSWMVIEKPTINETHDDTDDE